MPEQQAQLYDFATITADALLLAKTRHQLAGTRLLRSEMIKILREMDALRLDRPKAKPARVKRAPAATETDEAWLAELEMNPTYHGLDIRRELGKAQAWASVRGVGVNRRRFINWLNKALADRPVAFNGAGKSSFAKPATGGVQEPAGWREWARANMTNPEHADRSWGSFDASEQRYITEQVRKAL